MFRYTTVWGEVLIEYLTDELGSNVGYFVTLFLKETGEIIRNYNQVIFARNLSWNEVIQKAFKTFGEVYHDGRQLGKY